MSSIISIVAEHVTSEQRCNPRKQVAGSLHGNSAPTALIGRDCRPGNAVRVVEHHRNDNNNKVYNGERCFQDVCEDTIDGLTTASDE